MTPNIHKIQPFQVGTPRPKLAGKLTPEQNIADFRSACDVAIDGVIALAEARIAANTTTDEQFEFWIASRIAETVVGLLGWWSVRVRVVCALESGQRRISARIFAGTRSDVQYGSCSVTRLWLR